MRVNHIHVMQLNFWSHKISVIVNNYTDLANPYVHSHKYTTTTLKR